MKVEIINKETSDIIVVFDSFNLVDSKYYQIEEDLILYDDPIYTYFINEKEVTYSELENWVDIIAIEEIFPTLQLKVFDDRDNEQIIFKREDNTLFAIKYSKTF